MIVRVALEVALRKEFDYLVPPELEGEVSVGTRVKVPFGPRQLLGCVTAIIEEAPSRTLKPILKVVGKQSLVTPRVLDLARWMADYYCCPLETALKSVLPESVRRENARWKERLVVRIIPQAQPEGDLTARQKEIWSLLQEWRELPLQEVIKLASTTADTIRRLEDRGLVSIGPEISERDPYANEKILPSQPLALNPEQGRAFDAIKASLLAGESKTFLLHGVTGSGKTEVYLQAIAEALELGKGAIVLVPEISLTPQTVERFKSRFCSGKHHTLVAVLHSHLSGGERHDEWHKIRQGRARIVVGARSAVFAPVEPLGLIIVDEEHEHSYKQEEAPRYQARDMAVLRGQKDQAVTVLGSATPSLESFFNAQRGKYQLLEMPTRVDDQKMPVVRVIDMRSEARKEKGIPIFSQGLRDGIAARLDRKEQSILFLNRRGFATSLQCPLCGYVAECPNCSVSLTFHRKEARLRCHICGHDQPAPVQCPNEKCRNPAIRYAGIGTQKVEEALGQLFPHARVKRMDSDTLKKKEDYRRVLNDFRTGKIDILVGTQMIAKGLHFPNVTLAGIIHADLSLHVPDFRAGERTFQLLVQVAGRSGRGDVEGEVFVQSFTPFHPAIQYARRHDFNGFFEQELEFRKQLNYPPFSRVALLTLRGRNEEKVSFSADFVRKQIEARVGSPSSIIIAGPAAAPLARAETFYRYQIMLRTAHMPPLSRHLTAMQKELKLPEEVLLTIDIDPMSMM